MDDKVLQRLARHFASKNPNKVADYDDYLQEARLIALEVGTDKGEGYLYKSIRNGLAAKSTQWNCDVKTSQQAVTLCVKIYQLRQQNYTDDEIIQKLEISVERYLEVKNLLNNDILYDKIYNDTNTSILLDEIQEFLTPEENTMLQMYLQDFSVKEMSQRLGISYEWARKKLIQLINKLRNIYEYRHND